MKKLISILLLFPALLAAQTTVETKTLVLTKTLLIGTTPVVATPTFSPGTPYVGGNATVSISDFTPGSAITYCTSNSGTCTPVTSYTTGIAFTVSGPTNICAFATKTGYTTSSTACWVGTFQTIAWGQAGVCSSGSGTCAITLGSSVTAGSTLVIALTCGGGAPTVSDSLNGAFTQIGTPQTDPNTTFSVFYFKNSAAGSDTITPNCNSTAQHQAFIAAEILGANTTTPVDQTGVAAITTSATFSATTAGATGTASEMIIGVGGDAFTGASAVNGWTAGTGYTIPANGTYCPGTFDACSYLEYKIVSSTGTYTADATITNATAISGFAEVVTIQ